MEPCVSHDHDCDHSGCAGNSLWKVINHGAISCLNAQDDSLAKDVFRPWEQRRSRSPCLESNDDDAELLIRVPFTTDVKARLSGIVVSGDAGGSSPTRVRLFINRDDIDFALASELPPVQEFSLMEDLTASVEYQTRVSKFQCVSSLTLHFTHNGGASTTRLCFIGLRGQADPQSNREALATVVYETQARPQDHTVPADELATLQRLGH